MAGLQQDGDDDEAVLNAFYSYDSMVRGAGSFSEYYLRRDDPYTMRAVNLPFEALRQRAWTIMRSARIGELDEMRPADPSSVSPGTP